MAINVANPNSSVASKDVYFANLPRNEIGQELMKRVDDYYSYCQQFGRMRIWRRAYDYYYRGWMRGARLNRTGKQDEYMTMCVNEFRNILLHLLVSVTSQKITYEPKATNTDFESQAQTIVANGVLEHYNRILNSDYRMKKATENGLVFGEGWVAIEWDETLGPTYTMDNEGNPIKQGEVVMTNLTPMDVVRDYTIDDPNDFEWLIVRKYENRFNLMAKYPDLADRIKSLSTDQEITRNIRFSQGKKYDTDLIPVWRFYHDKSTAVADGRFVEFLASDLITLDGGLPYEEKPVYRISPDEQIKSPFGYTVSFDLLPLQEMLDGLYSIIVTNQSTFGVQNIAMPNGANINVNALGEGLNLITYDPKFGAPTALNLVQTPKEIFSFIDMITARMETIAGVNSVVRGNPEASLKSGAALALVASQAIQFNSGLAQSFNKLVENVGTALINILKEYAKTPRMIAIAGKSNRAYMSQFKADDLINISRVTVDVGNPLSRTTAGKLQIADNLLQSGMIKDPEQYIQVATTGRLEPLLENTQSQLMLVRAENEKLADGVMTPALITDDHRLHILEHGVVLASPEARENPMVIQTALAHIQEHITHLQTGDPTILSLYGQPQVQPPIGGVGQMPEQMNAENQVVQEAQAVNQPNMPTNPLTGEQFSNQIPVGGAV